MTQIQQCDWEAGELNLSDDEKIYDIGNSADYLIVFAIAITMVFMRSIIHNLVLMPLAERFKISSRRARLKFAENAWFTAYYAPIFLWGLSLVQRHAMSFPYARLIVNFPQFAVNAEIKAYMLVQLAFYIHCLVVVLFMESKKSDFLQMVVHHAVTIFLFVMSFDLGVRNLGVTVVVLHDFSDIFLYAAKAFHYLLADTAANVAFATLAVTFAAARLAYFPTIIYTWYSLGSGIESDLLPPVKLYSVTASLCLLLCLHVFWFRLIMIVIRRSLSAGKVEGDIRSEIETDTDEDD